MSVLTRQDNFVPMIGFQRGSCGAGDHSVALGEHHPTLAQLLGSVLWLSSLAQSTAWKGLRVTATVTAIT